MFGTSNADKQTLLHEINSGRKKTPTRILGNTFWKPLLSLLGEKNSFLQLRLFTLLNETGNDKSWHAFEVIKMLKTEIFWEAGTQRQTFKIII